MSHYKELKKIRRNSGGGLIYETTIAQDYKQKFFESGFSHSTIGIDSMKGTTTMKAIRDYGAGIKFEIYTVRKGRVYAQSMELGKSEVELLKEFIAMVEGELKDYNGTYEPTKLVDLTK